MRNIFLKTLGTAALAFLMLAMFAQIPVSAQDDTGDEEESGAHISASGQRVGNPRSIEGVWRNQITIRDCASGTVLATVSGFLNYHQGGTMSETTATNPALRSPGYGIWESRGRRSYGGKFTYFTFNADGSTSGGLEVNQNIVISPDGTRLTDNALTNIFDANGNLIVTVCARAEATRFR